MSRPGEEPGAAAGRPAAGRAAVPVCSRHFRRPGAWAALRFGAALAGLVLVAGAFAAEPQDILHPARPTPPAPSAGGSLGNMTLVVGLMLAAAGGWLVLRGRRLAPGSPAGQSLRIEETRSLGNRQFLVVAAYEDKKFLLGVCQGRIDLLAPLSDGAGKPPA